MCLVLCGALEMTVRAHNPYLPSATLGPAIDAVSRMVLAALHTGMDVGSIPTAAMVLTWKATCSGIRSGEIRTAVFFGV